MNTTQESIKKIHTKAISIVEEYHTNLQAFIAKCDDPLILKFIDTFFHLYEKNNTLLYRMFNDVVYFCDISILGTLESFLINYFLDDSYFTVNWYEHGRDDNGSLIKILSDKEDKWSFPVVEWDNDNGSQDPQILLDAMEEMVERDKAFYARLKLL
jgi:hypothetical protein